MGSAPTQLSVVTPGRITWPGPVSQTGRGRPPWAGALHQPGGHRGPVLSGRQDRRGLTREPPATESYGGRFSPGVDSPARRELGGPVRPTRATASGAGSRTASWIWVYREAGCLAERGWADRRAVLGWSGE